MVAYCGIPSFADPNNVLVSLAESHSIDTGRFGVISDQAEVLVEDGDMLID